jgi:hypothetical protein
MGLGGAVAAARRNRILGRLARLLLLSQPLDCSSIGVRNRRPLAGEAPAVAGALGWGNSTGTIGAGKNGSAILLF